ncbi:MAG: phosphoribosylanthranilate isomerase [Pseudomonadota bacterium]
MSIKMKFCGLTRPEDIVAAAQAGAAYIGFNFFPKSPRYVTPKEAAKLAEITPEGITKVALVVNPTDALLTELVETVPLDLIQLHGTEPPARVVAVKALTSLPVMKVLGVAGADDVARIAEYETVADQILVDAKPPKDAVLPGGNGVAFDWHLLEDRDWKTPWMLAGGLTSANVAEAVRQTGATQVDLASGIESAPGVKDAGLMQAFATALSPR